jgi:alpha-1,3-rhamnosyl/mannosyltransferase
MSLRVAINATPLLAPLTGIGNYIVELGAALAAQGDIDLHSFYALRWRHEAPAQDGSGSRLPRLVDRVKPWIPWRRALRHAVGRASFRRGLRRLSIELYHEPNFVPLAYDVAVVTTVHDLSWVHAPDAHPVERIRWLERGVPQALARAAIVLVDSAFVRDEVTAIFGVAPAKVRVAHLGVASDFRPRDATSTAATLHPLGLRHGQYVLTVGTLEPRKNLGHLVAAHRQLAPRLRERFPLVIAGARGWHSTERDVRAGTAGDAYVRFLGSVRRADLLDLYAGAALFAFPSLYEGFGLPPLEAMASGAPVLVSGRASLPEVVGEAGALLDPHDVPAAALALNALLEDPLRRGQMRARGLARARAFSWQACARATAQAYAAAMNRV